MVACIKRARGHDIGRPVGNAKVLEEMRELREHMEAMEKDRQRDPEVGDVSEPEDEEKREEVAPMQKTPELIYFRPILGVTSRTRPELPTYYGSLVAKHLIDWISELDK